MEDKILNELQAIKKELQDIHNILEPKEMKVELFIGGESAQGNTDNLIKENG